MFALRTRAGLASAVALFAAAGCGGRSVDDAAHSANAFYDALGRGDGPAACAELSPKTRSTLVQAAGKPCHVAVLEEPVPRPGEVRDEHRFGTSAQIRYTADTVFLGRYPDGWRVTAAGCTRRPHLPYDCRIEGG